MIKPSSICTLSTKNSIKDLVLLLESLNYIKYDKTIYIICDSFTQNQLSNHKYNFIIQLFNELDKYETICLVNQYNSKEEWTKFMLEKTTIINYALTTNSDTLFVDSDIMFLNELPDVDPNYELGLCPHNILKSHEEKYGKYNGGSLWVNTNKFTSWWVEETFKDTTKYMEQQCLDDAPNYFKTMFFNNNHNFGWWRLQVNEAEEIKSRRHKFKFKNNTTYYDNKPLISIHTHFYDTTSRQVCLFNKFMKNYLNDDIKQIIINIENNIFSENEI